MLSAPPLYRMHYLNDAINSAIELYRGRGPQRRGVINEDDVPPINPKREPIHYHYERGSIAAGVRNAAPPIFPDRAAALIEIVYARSSVS